MSFSFSVSPFSFKKSRQLAVGSWQSTPISVSSVPPQCPLWLTGHALGSQQKTTESTEKARRAQRLLIYFLFPLLLIGCGEDHQHSEENGHEHPNGGSGEAHAEREADLVHLTPPQVRNAGIETAPPQRMDLAHSIQATGKLELPPKNRAGVSPNIGGNVSDINVIQGQKVEEGEVLAVLEHPDIIQLQQEFLEEQEELRYRKKELERVRSLYEDSVGAAREFQKAKAAYERVLARVNTQGAKLSTADIDTGSLKRTEKVQRKIPLRAPIGGVVSEVNVDLGSYAEQNEELFKVLDIHHMHIDLMVYEKDLHKVKVGQHVLFDLIGRETPRPMHAEVFGLGNSFDETRKAAKVHAEIKDPLGPLFPGIYVEAMIDVDSAKEASVVPEEAVLLFEEQHYIYLDQGMPDSSKRVFRQVPVRKGIAEKGYVEIEPLEGALPEDAEVVVQGAPYLLRHMRKGIGGHSH